MEEVENDDGEQAEQQWTDEDKIFLTSCLGLTKSAKVNC